MIAVRNEEKKSRRAARQREPREKGARLAALVGFITVLFALTGIGLSLYLGIGYMRERAAARNDQTAKYNDLLTPIAAVDPDPFDEITAADNDQLLDAAIWAILSEDSTPDTYGYEKGYLLIPEADVMSAFSVLFGQEAAADLTHDTVQGYNYRFLYDAAAGRYKIPITSIKPVYTPQVTEVKQDGDSIIVTVGYLSSESWDTDEQGNMIRPEPEKTMKVTFSSISGSMCISSIRLVSRTVPETVAPPATTAARTTAPAQNEPKSEAVSESVSARR